MSLNRFIFYGAVIGGWSAFVGWLLCEVLFNHRQQLGWLKLTFTGALVGGAICAGLLVVAVLVNPQWPKIFKRAGIGFGVGFVGGMFSALIGNGAFKLLGENIFGYTIGWTLLGIGIGSVVGATDGFFDRNWKKIRNGIIGGSIGGFLGGLLFTPIAGMIGSAMSSRAAAFVILGVCIGLFIGIAQVLLREAWLTVEEGFRPGRQLILSLAETTLGTSEKGQLIFIAFGAKGVEPVHLKIIRHEDGGYYLYDNQSRTGTFLNNQRIARAVRLKSNDVIGFGVNRVRYQERMKQAAPGTSSAAPAAVPSQHVQAAKPPSPKPSVPVAHIREARPQAVPVQARPARPQTEPAPIPAQPKPVQRPAPQPQTSSAPAKAACPICGKQKTGVPGKRICNDCRIHF